MIIIKSITSVMIKKKTEKPPIVSLLKDKVKIEDRYKIRSIKKASEIISVLI